MTISFEVGHIDMNYTKYTEQLFRRFAVVQNVEFLKKKKKKSSDDNLLLAVQCFR